MNLAAVILAAGYSKRMGVLKPLLPAGEHPAVLRCAHLLSDAGVRDILIVTGHHRSEIEDALRGAPPYPRFIYNDRYRDGMFSSVYAGAAALRPGIDGFFLLPADCCAVSPAALALLTDTFSKTGGSVVVRPKLDMRRGHPPLIPARFIDAVLSYSGENGLKGILSALPSVEVETGDPGVLLDMDTPGDYTMLLAHLGLPVYPGRAQCFRLFEKHGTPSGIIEHGEQTAALALRLARLMTARGAALNFDLLESACLLHDIKRAEPNHAQAGMELLLCEGFPKAATLVGEHMDGPDVSDSELGESALLFLADKLCRNGGYVKIEDTLRTLEARFSANPDALAHAKARMERAQTIMNRLGGRFDIGYNDIIG